MHGTSSPDGPLAQFFQLVPGGLPPRRADKSVGGVIPARALRYCEAITSASGFGWYVFLPMNFKVVWDGTDMLWTYPGVDVWLPLTRDAVQYPGFREHFDRHAPPEARGFSPTSLVLRMTREEIGSYVGLSLETVSRLFSRFQDDGLIEVQQKHVRIVDIAGLERLLATHG